MRSGVIIRHGVSPEKEGWQRKFALDTEKCEAWETPDGTIYLHLKELGPLLLVTMDM